METNWKKQGNWFIPGKHAKSICGGVTMFLGETVVHWLTTNVKKSSLVGHEKYIFL